MEIQTFEQFATKDGGTLYKATLIDKSKPSAVRCSTPLIMFLGAEGRKQLPKGDPADALVDVIVRRFANNNGDVQIKGEIAPPEKGAASSPAKPASSPSQAK